MTARELFGTQQSLEKSRRDAGGAPLGVSFSVNEKARVFSFYLVVLLKYKNIFRELYYSSNLQLVYVIS